MSAPWNSRKAIEYCKLVKAVPEMSILAKRGTWYEEKGEGLETFVDPRARQSTIKHTFIKRQMLNRDKYTPIENQPQILARGFQKPHWHHEY